MLQASNHLCHYAVAFLPTDTKFYPEPTGDCRRTGENALGINPYVTIAAGDEIKVVGLAAESTFGITSG